MRITGLSLASLFIHSTIRKLAAFLEKNPKSAENNIILMNSRCAHARLFCIHPAFGIINDYRAIANALDGLAEVHGIESPILSEHGWRGQTMEELSEEYVRRLRRVQPSGPYFLLGWSLGGWIALEMARVLKSQGQDIGLLALVDTIVPVERRDPDESRSPVERNEEIDIGELVRRMPAYRQDETLSEDDKSLLANVARADKYHQKIMAGYRLNPFALDLHLWWAALEGDRTERDRNWSVWTTGEIPASSDIKASHIDIIQDRDFVSGLRALIAEKLASEDLSPAIGRKGLEASNGSVKNFFAPP